MSYLVLEPAGVPRCGPSAVHFVMRERENKRGMGLALKEAVGGWQQEGGKRDQSRMGEGRGEGRRRERRQGEG